MNEAAPAAQIEHGSKPSGTPRRRDIQGLRAVAVILVVADHAGVPVPGGFTGVDIFFVISGFVISSLILRELDRTGRLAIPAFYVRRALRLLPALAVMVTVTAALGMLLLSPFGIQQESAVTGGAASFWTSNFALIRITASYFSPQAEMNPFLHTWSLGVEEQFYLVFPFILLTGWSIGRRIWGRPIMGAVIAAAVTAIASLSLSIAASFGLVIPAMATFAFFGSPTRAWEFGAGSILALAVLRSSSWLHKLERPAAWAGAGLVVVGVCVISSSEIFPGLLVLVPVIGAVLIISSGIHCQDNTVSKVLSWRGLVYIGDVSYGWYLWHWPFIAFARRIAPTSIIAVPIAVLLSFAMAVVSYRYIESRWRRKSAAVSLRRVVSFGLTILVPATSCGLLLIGAQYNWNDPSLAAASKQLLERPLGYNDCLSDTPITQRDLTVCTWGKERPGRPIYLLGDSNAQQFTEAMISASEAANRPLVIATMGGCALVAVETRIKTDPGQEESCASWVKDANQWIRSQKVGTVVLGAAGEGITDPTVAYRTTGREWAVDEASKTATWTEGMISEIGGLQSMGQEVLLVHVVPHFTSPYRPWWSPVECPNSTSFTNPEECGVKLRLDEVEARQSAEFGAEEEAVKLTGARSLNLRSVLCPGNMCETVNGGFWIYRDGLHVSPRESKRLGPIFGRELAES